MYILPELTAEEIIIYLRKSRTDDATLTVEEVLANHEQRLNDWVARNLPDAGPIPESNRYREIVSGETIASRPAVKEVLRRIESPSIKAVLIVEPQRLSRGDLEDIGRLVKLLRYSNTIVITESYSYDLRDARDRDDFERELKRGNDYLEYQKRILNNGRLLSLQNGNYIGQHPPYGYRKITVKEGKKTCHTLEPHPDEAPVVQHIFKRYAEGAGMGQISDELLAMGVKTLKGEKLWARTTLRGIMGNEHYLGQVRWFRKKTIRTVQDGEIVEKRPEFDEYLIYPGKHPAIIDQETWDKVQERLGSNPRNHKAGNLRNPLAGLLFCAKCGKAMKRHEHYKVVDGERVAYAAERYNCSNTKICRTPSCRVDEVVDQVKIILREAIEDFEIRVSGNEDDSLEMHRQMIARLEKRLSEIEALEVAQWEKYTLESMPKSVFDNLNSKVLAEKEEVQQALCIAKESVPEPVNVEEKLETFRTALQMLENPEESVREVNFMLKQCFKRIDYSRTPAEGISARWKTGNPFVLKADLKI